MIGTYHHPNMQQGIAHRALEQVYHGAQVVVRSSVAQRYPYLSKHCHQFVPSHNDPNE